MYAHANPTVFVDPTGYLACDVNGCYDEESGVSVENYDDVLPHEEETAVSLPREESTDYYNTEQKAAETVVRKQQIAQRERAAKLTAESRDGRKEQALVDLEALRQEELRKKEDADLQMAALKQMANALVKDAISFMEGTPLNPELSGTKYWLGGDVYNEVEENYTFDRPADITREQWAAYGYGAQFMYAAGSIWYGGTVAGMRRGATAGKLAGVADEVGDVAKSKSRLREFFTEWGPSRAGQEGSVTVRFKAQTNARHGDFHGPWREYSENYNWGAHKRARFGPAPDTLTNPHPHHTLMKKGRGRRGRDFAREGQDILRRRAGIDPLGGNENLVWAELYGKDIHTTARMEEIVSSLRKLDNANAPPEAFLDAMKSFGQQASKSK